MASGLKQIIGNMISRITASKTPVSKPDQEAALNLSVKVMSLVSAVDGQIDRSEVKLVQEVYFDRLGNLVEPATIERAFEIVLGDQDSFWRDLEAGRHLDEELRLTVFQSAIEIAAADGDLHESESRLLRQIGSTLDLPIDFIDWQLETFSAR